MCKTKNILTAVLFMAALTMWISGVTQYSAMNGENLQPNSIKTDTLFL